MSWSYTDTLNIHITIIASYTNNDVHIGFNLIESDDM